MEVEFGTSIYLPRPDYLDGSRNWHNVDQDIDFDFLNDIPDSRERSAVSSIVGDDCETGSLFSEVSSHSRNQRLCSSSCSSSVCDDGDYRSWISQRSTSRHPPPNGSIPEDHECQDVTGPILPYEINYGIGNRRHPVTMKSRNIDANRWISADEKNGYLRVYSPDNVDKCQLIACTTDTPAYKVCFQLGIAPNALHIQYGDDFTRRLRPNERPLLIQNDYLYRLGYLNHRRIQKLGTSWELGYLIRVFSGWPSHDSSFTSSVLHGVLEVHKGKVFKSWKKSLCVLNGTRLLVYKDVIRNGRSEVYFLEKGEITQFYTKNRPHCVRVTSHLQNKIIRLSFENEHQFYRWQQHFKKAITKQPTTADLSQCNLEALPEPLFNHADLLILNLRKNTMRNRPDASEGGQAIGWIEDIQRFTHLKVLNLADNDLREFPKSLCQIATLSELNVSSNKIPDIPKEIALLRRLNILHIHNNYLMHLPRELTQLSNLDTVVLAFNMFTEIPEQLSGIADRKNENIIMAGNRISRIHPTTLSKMHFVCRIDLRFNKLTFTGDEVNYLHHLSKLSHLDVRDNNIESLDLRPLVNMEYVYCERNSLSALHLHGAKLKILQASENVLEHLQFEEKPENIEIVNVRKNKLKTLPTSLCGCPRLRGINASNNRITTLPPGLFSDTSGTLRVLHADHNCLKGLPEEIVSIGLEELYLQHNWISSLPQEFLRFSNKLRVLNLSKNRLVNLPPLHETVDKNKVQELYLSFNYLRNNSLNVISGYLRLKVLHIAHNRLSLLSPSDLMKFEFLRELNVSGNRLQGLPRCILTLTELHTLRAHSNVLMEIPQLNEMKSLKVLDLGCNHLRASSIRSLVDSKLNLLDISCNQCVNVSMKDFSEVKTKKKICLVDMTGENRSIPGSIPMNISRQNVLPFAVGLAETSGQRNKLNVSVIKKLNFPSPESATFAMFDGGHNNTVPKLLQTHFPFVFVEELKAAKDEGTALKYTTLTCHKKLKAAGQRLGASSAICYLKHTGDQWRLYVANAGDVEVVTSQGGCPVVLSRRHRLDEDREEAERIMNIDGIITEDGKLNGVSLCTRMIGCNYLFPQMLPDPHVAATTLTSEDDAVIIANRNLWNAVSYEEAVQEVNRIRQPVVAAKRLMDLAQSNGSNENIVILVLKFVFDDDIDPYSTAREWRYDDDSEDDSNDWASHREIDSSLQSIRSLDSLNKYAARSRGPGERMRQGRSQREGPNQRKPRLYMKKHETDELDVQLKMRLAEEVKTREMDALVHSLGDSSDFSGDENWSAVLPEDYSPSQKISSYLGQTYRTIAVGDASPRMMPRDSLDWNVDMHMFDRIGDAGIPPSSIGDASSLRTSVIDDISEEEEASRIEEDYDSDDTIVDDGAVREMELPQNVPDLRNRLRRRGDVVSSIFRPPSPYCDVDQNEATRL